MWAAYRESAAAADQTKSATDFGLARMSNNVLAQASYDSDTALSPCLTQRLPIRLETGAGEREPARGAKTVRRERR